MSDAVWLWSHKMMETETNVEAERSGVAWDGGGGGGRGYKKKLWGDGHDHYLNGVMVSWMYTYAKTFQMAYLQYVPFVSLQLHFNKAVKQKLPSQSLLHCHYLTYFSPKEKLILNQLIS